MAIGTGSILSLKLRKITNASDLGCAGMLLCSLLQLLNFYFGVGFWGYEILVFFMLFSVGMVFTTSTTLAMTEGKAMVGWASAIVGATGFLFGGIVTPLVGIGSIQISTYCIMTVCSLVSLIISCMAYRSKPVIV